MTEISPVTGASTARRYRPWRRCSALAGIGKLGSLEMLSVGAVQLVECAFAICGDLQHDSIGRSHALRKPCAQLVHSGDTCGHAPTATHVAGTETFDATAACGDQQPAWAAGRYRHLERSRAAL